MNVTVKRFHGFCGLDMQASSVVTKTNLVKLGLSQSLEADGKQGVEWFLGA